MRRQSDLVGLLKKDGFEVTQSSVSRDMRELGVLKAQGRYLPPAEEVAQAQGNFSAIDRFVRDIKHRRPLDHRHPYLRGRGRLAWPWPSTRPHWPEVVGTISGDDTIFIATAGRAGADAPARRACAPSFRI